MLIIGIISIIFIIGIVIWVINRDTYGNLNLTGYITTILSGILLISAIIALLAVKQDNKKIYNQLQEQEKIILIQYETAKESGNYIVLSEVYKLAILHNNTIIEHRTHYNNIWYGAFYSEKIANMELIK